MILSIANPEILSFANTFSSWAGLPTNVELTPISITLQWDLDDETTCVMRLSACGCCYMCGGPLSAPAPLWEYACQWKKHTDISSYVLNEDVTMH